MENFALYKDIQARTNGEIYVGVVGPVRTGKSTFIRRFMEILALPNLKNGQLEEVKDQLPVSGSGRQVTTVEPKFIPKEACEVKLSSDITVKMRLIDCVGYMIPQASGDMEEDKERMVKTPWFDKPIPFHQAAEYGTQKVIYDHSTIGLVITSDGSFGDFSREDFLESEARTIEELQNQKKPFLVLVNSEKPFKEETQKIVSQIKEKYQVMAMSVNCEQLRMEDILHIFENILYEFPVSQVEFYIPKWVEMLPADHYIKEDILKQICQSMEKIERVKDVSKDTVNLSSEYIKSCYMEQVDMSTGTVCVRVEMKQSYYYQVISEMTGVPIASEYDLIHTVRDLSSMRNEYTKVLDAMENVRISGYAVVMPDRSEITIEEPTLIKQGGKYGVKIKSQSPSLHLIKANVETEIAPIVGSEEQANDLIAYIRDNGKKEAGIWDTNIFGKSIEQLVEDGIRSKIAKISDESQVKLQDTMKKIVNDSNGGMVCIII